MQSAILRRITVIRDTQTDLDWEVKSSEPNDEKFFKRLMTWAEFKSYVDYLNKISYGGFSDWRVPSKHELRSLINYSGINPAYQKEIFKTVVPNDYWCGAEPFGPRQDCAWVINFNIGSTTAKNQSLQSHGIAVRGKKLPPPQERFKDNGDGTITDNYLKLMWQKGANGRTSYAQVMEMLPNFELAGHKDWRLPTVDELRFIVDYSKKNPAVFDIFACRVRPDFYWTAEYYPAPSGERNWAIYFGFGCAVPVDKNQPCGCIAVTGGYQNLADKSKNRYEIADEYVIDKYTSLMWMRNELPVMTWAEYDKYLSENTIAGFNDWRIPEMKELSTILRRSDKNKEWFDPELFPHIYDTPRSFFIARETFNGMFNWGCNMIFAYDGYYADRLNGKYRIKAVRNV